MEYTHSVPLFLEGITKTCLPVFVPIRNPVRGRAEFLFLSEVKTVTSSDIKRLFQHVLGTTLRFLCNPNSVTFAEDMISTYGKLLLDEVVSGVVKTLCDLFLQHAQYWSTQTTRCMFVVQSEADLKYICYHNILCAYLQLLLHSSPEKASALAVKARDVSIKCAVSLFETQSATLRRMCAPLLSETVYESACPLFIECLELFRVYSNPWAAKPREMCQLNVNVTEQTVAWDKAIQQSDSEVDIAKSWILMPIMALLHDFQATTYMCRVIDLANVQLAAMEVAETEDERMGLLDFLMGLKDHAKKRLKALSMNSVLERTERTAAFSERQSRLVDAMNRFYKMPLPNPDKMDQIYGNGIVPLHLIECTRKTRDMPGCRLNVLTTHFEGILGDYRLPNAWITAKAASFRSCINRLEQLTSDDILTERAMEFSRNMNKYLLPE